jgi:hypothetical protein
MVENIVYLHILCHGLMTYVQIAQHGVTKTKTVLPCHGAEYVVRVVKIYTLGIVYFFNFFIKLLFLTISFSILFLIIVVSFLLTMMR